MYIQGLGGLYPSLHDNKVPFGQQKVKDFSIELTFCERLLGSQCPGYLCALLMQNPICWPCDHLLCIIVLIWNQLLLHYYNTVHMICETWSHRGVNPA